MNPWILVFEPQNKIVSQVVTFAYQGVGPANGKKVENPSPENSENIPVPVEITISEREIDLDGVVKYPSARGADDFVVYPSQFILYPGDTKKVQVQWVGGAIPSREISLGFISTQLPLKFNENQEQPKSAVGIVALQTRYEGIIVVRPQGVKPAVIVDTAYYQNDSAGTHLVAILENKGTGLQPLKDLQLTVAPLDKSGSVRMGDKVVVKEKASSPAVSQSLLAGFKRRIVVPWPPGFPVARIKATVEFPEPQK